MDKHGHNFVIFSQATGQTWNHTSAYHLSTLVHQPWMNYVNNENEYLIIGVIVRSEYSTIWYLHLVIGTGAAEGVQDWSDHLKRAPV